MDDYKMDDIVVITKGKFYGIKEDFTGMIGIINHIYDCSYGVRFDRTTNLPFTKQEFRKATSEEIKSRKEEIEKAKEAIEYHKSLWTPLNLNIKKRGENYYVKH